MRSLLVVAGVLLVVFCAAAAQADCSKPTLNVTVGEPDDYGRIQVTVAYQNAGYVTVCFRGGCELWQAYRLTSPIVTSIDASCLIEPAELVVGATVCEWLDPDVSAEPFRKMIHLPPAPTLSADARGDDPHNPQRKWIVVKYEYPYTWAEFQRYMWVELLPNADRPDRVVVYRSPDDGPMNGLVRK